VTLIGIGVAADVALTLTHNEVPSIFASVIVAGVGIVQAFAHARARSNGASKDTTQNGSPVH
jgi:hypothetical protein